MPISRLAILCCREAASASAPPEPPGHPLALFGDAQRRLYEDSPVSRQVDEHRYRCAGGAGWCSGDA